MSLADLKFTEDEMAAKQITSLADRPALSAGELKERFDSGDIRTRLNTVLDALPENFAAKEALTAFQNQLMIFNTLEMAAVSTAMRAHPNGERFFAFFLDTGKIFCGTPADLLHALSHGLAPVWDQ